jgi:hypothetical protein
VERGGDNGERNFDLTYRTLCRLLAGQVDATLTSTLGSDKWGLLAATAQREGVAPLLYHALNSPAPLPRLADAPPDIQTDLRQAYYATTARNLLAYHELSRILAALAARFPTADCNPHHASHFTFYVSRITQLAIPTVILKGAALATTLYPSIGLRPMGDLDLLVPEDHLAEAVARLKALGYVEPYPEMAPGLNALAGHHVHLQGGQDIPVTVELHWTLIGGPHDWRSPSLPWFWAQTEEWKTERGGWKRESVLHPPSSIFLLTPTAHLLYLCAHLMLQHGEARSTLRWFYDIHLLVERESQRIQWDEVVARAREFRWAPAVHAALKGSQDRFGTRLPPGALEALVKASDVEASRLVARRADGLQTRATGVVAAASSLSPGARLRLLLAIAIPSPAYIRWRYKPRPAWLWPLCYPYRWLDILREGLSTALKLAMRSSRDGAGRRSEGTTAHSLSQSPP